MTQQLCEVCGEPMKEGEEMFKFHGSMGPCPKPPLPVKINFGRAIKILKEGGHVRRKGWNGIGQYLTLQVPDAHSKMSLPYIYITTVEGSRVPWLASQTDVLSDDWSEVSGLL